KVGDKIKLTTGTEEEVLDSLKVEELEVVGTGSSAAYISLSRGSTTVGTGSVEGFLVVTEDTFDMDVYTEVYVQVEGAKELIAYTDEYEAKVEKVLEDIESETEIRGVVRKQEIVDEAYVELNDAKTELADVKAEVEEELADAKEQIVDAEKQISDGKEKIRKGRNQIYQAKKTLASEERKLKKAESEYEEGLKRYEAGYEEYQKGLAEYEAQRTEAEVQIQAGRQQMEQLQMLMQMENLRLSELQGKIEAGTATEEEQAEASELAVKISQEEQVYMQTTAQLDEAQKELDSTEETLTAARIELEASKKQLDDAKKQIRSGKKQISDGWKELEQSETELDEGASEIIKNEEKLEEAKADYEEGKIESEEEIAEAEQEIADAEEEIRELENPKWYVYDRTTLPEYTGFGDNAARVGAIGKVFPVIFFLVAAMISLTSMTRMVEEQRTIIGTMKALGYSRFAIASKYLGYALFATLGGSIAGVLIGEKIIPWVIVFAYSIIYPNLPEILTPYEMKFALMASIAAIACTTAATLVACYKELEAQPAVLMRPPTPKKGKRVLLERIEFIWKCLNFSWKSTVRNLFRYKKRFFMTIFGISGCMALLLVGFGLKDSIFEISALQYKDIQIYDGMIYKKENLTVEDEENLERYLSQNPEINRFMPVDMTGITLKNGKKERQTYQVVFSTLENIDQYVHFQNRETDEKYELSDNGVIISEKTAKLLEAEVGDTIEIKDEENGNKEIVIEHITENYMSHYVYFTKEYYEKVYGEEAEYNSILFATDDSYEAWDIENVGTDILKQEEVLSVTYMHDIQKNLDNMLGSLNLVILVLIISAGMLAFVVLYNLNTVNITERKRELATLKVLGFYDPEVAAYVYRENILLTFIGAFFGVFFGKVLHSFIIGTVEVDAAMFGRVIKPISYLYSLLFTIAFSMIVNGVMYFKLKKIDMVESLKSIE
ncbi:MAG: FtsX-like permease family protein, partial [Dorea sp.]